MKNVIAVCVTIMALSGGVMALTWAAITTPDVYVSNTTNECVKVINYGSDYSCENMPTKYNKVWVK